MLNPFKKKTTPAADAAQGEPSHRPLDLGSHTSLAKTARVSLQKAGLDGLRACVYLVLDRSYSMNGYYSSGAVQYLAEQALGLAVNLDDDGVVPVVFFDDKSYPVTEVAVANRTGVIDREHRGLGGERTMGGTRYEKAIGTVVDHYRAYQGSGGTDPAVVIFQTDGHPQGPAAATTALAAASKLPIFWSFVSFGPGPVDYLRQLDTMTGRAVDNASYWHAGFDPQRQVSTDTTYDQALYNHLVAEIPAWLTAARAAGVIA
ncbi:VWA domain-containing protein [Streptomyces sp. R302]|uniref:VWA domain-containing protein n=1 Tax=unclassified Streptomyces TaxID=2593676 RepID=UPI00145D4661|nr:MULTISPECIES: VWA domain-containing protein [unclassified Streptomyces]NML55318.1 VWA domain-containing protein [Streptomyces sp. R301]NML80190.1 VWA domain-containing protein [Streptomyces sp. R302]